jgi:signal transduction histidine kinase
MLSIKQKQVVGVTSIVALVAIALSVVHLVVLARVMLQENRARGELLATAVFHRAQQVVTDRLQGAQLVADREAAYSAIRSDPGVRSMLESAIYSQEVTYACILDTAGTIVAHSDPARIGERLPESGDLDQLLAQSGLDQLRAVYSTGRTVAWRQPMLLGADAFGEIQIGISTLLVRRQLDASLGPAVVVAGIALLVAVAIAMLLSQIVLRPIHVIQSGLSRLGRGELGVTLDLKDDEFKDLGDVFASVTEQLRSVTPDGAKRRQLVELSRRVMALGRLTAGVAHEVKNPLNAMTIHLELLRQKLTGVTSAGPAVQHVDVIGREIRRLDDVVQGFLKFARPEELTLQPVSLEALVAEVFRIMEAEARATGVVLEQSFEPGLPAVDADPTMLRQALLNLAKNAVQAMPHGGRLRAVGATSRDGRVELRIEDTGVGIPPESLAKIFDLYFTTKAGGTGIGLSLVYRTIQLHHGDVEVASTPGKGTTFVIKLPVAR